MKKLVIILLIMISIHLFADFDFAVKLFNDGLIEESKAEFEKVINNSPASEKAPEANYYIALGYIQKKDYDNAIKYLKRIITAYKNYHKTDLALSELAKTYLKNNDYKESVKYFNLLFKNYPTSQYMKKSLKPFADALLLSKDYNYAIVVLDKLIKNYPTSKYAPYLYLSLAKAYYHDNITAKSKEIAQKIIKKYPNSNERWETEMFLLEIQNLSPQKYISKIKNILNKKLPRKYDERFSYILAEKYLEIKDYQNAGKTLSYIVKKYENSINLCKYLKSLMYANLQLGKAVENIALFTQNKKKIPKSKCKRETKLLLAKSYIIKQDYAQADAVLQDLQKTELSDSLAIETQITKSQLLIKTNRFVPAIKNYLKILEKYPKSGKNNYLYFQIAKIYKDNLQKYQKAIEFFKRISPYSNYYTKSLIEISTCYEFLQDYQKAAITLNEIELNSIKDENLKNRIKQRLTYLDNFKIKNYKSAFNHLLSAMISYNNTNDKKAYENALLSIYTDDLKQYQDAKKLLENTDNYYLKAKILIKLIKKSLLEGNSANKYQNELQTCLSNLSGEQFEEISLKNQTIKKIDDNTIKKLKNFIAKYPDSPASDNFRLKVAEYYMNKGQIQNAKDYIYALKPQKNSNLYYKLKIALAEYYYSKDEDSLALNLYQDALDKINLSNPKIMFHYSVTLYQNGKYDQAINKLKFLSDNTEFFAGKQNMNIFLAKILAENNQIKQAISYLKMIPEKYRNDDYYKLIYQYYLKQNDYENAKLAIMHIKKKDIALLNKLADLQIKTGEKEMAIYTLNQLIKKDKNKLGYYSRLAQLYFDTKNYKDAQKYYSLYINGKTVKKEDKEAIIHLIISYLKLKNRPKADLIKKRYKKLFDDNDKALLNLNYGIYYLNIDSKTAIKRFSSIIKSKKTKSELKYKAYFWRGVAYIKSKQTDKALRDFLQAKKSDDKQLLYNVHLKLGTIYYSKEDYENALKNYGYVINNAQNDKIAFDAAKNFAMVCKTTKEWEKAVETYNLILDRWGNDDKIKAQTLFDIGFSYFRDKKYSKAIEYFKMALPLLQDTDMKAETQYWIGESYFGLENFEQSITEFLKVYYNYPSQTRWAASSQLKAAEAYIKMNEYEKAKKILNRIIKKYGKSSNWGKQAVDMLKEM